MSIMKFPADISRYSASHLEWDKEAPVKRSLSFLANNKAICDSNLDLFVLSLEKKYSESRHNFRDTVCFIFFPIISENPLINHAAVTIIALIQFLK